MSMECFALDECGNVRKIFVHREAVGKIQRESIALTELWIGVFRVCRISTVFLGLDHSYILNGTPVVFETMILPGQTGFLDDDGTVGWLWDYDRFQAEGDYQTRACTLTEAHDHHEEAEKYAFEFVDWLNILGRDYRDFRRSHEIVNERGEEFDSSNWIKINRKIFRNREGKIQEKQN